MVKGKKGTIIVDKRAPVGYKFSSASKYKGGKMYQVRFIPIKKKKKK